MRKKVEIPDCEMISQALPPDPYQLRVDNTRTYIIFSKYGRRISSNDVVRMCFEAQAAVIEAIVINKGDGPMPRLRPLHWYHDIQMRIAPGGKMSWLMLSHTLNGIVQFLEMFSAVTVQFEVLDTEYGPVGTGDISYARRPGTT